MSDELTTKDAAEMLHVSAETVRLYARQGRLVFVTTPGGHRRYERGSVEALRDGGAGSSISIGPADLSEIGPTVAAVNLDGPSVNLGMALDAAALAAGPQDRGPIALADGVSNPVHAALMAWAAPARVPAVAGR
jgi:excisionase family DNA binding protein